MPASPEKSLIPFGPRSHFLCKYSKHGNASETQVDTRAQTPSCLSSLPRQFPPSHSPSCCHSPEERPSFCRFLQYHYDAGSVGRRRKEKKKCFCCDKCQLCQYLKRTVVCKMDHYPNAQKLQSEASSPGSETVWLSPGGNRGKALL